jgi:hypothetical protein
MNAKDRFAELDDMHSRLLLAVVRQMKGARVAITFDELDETENFVLMMHADRKKRTYYFELVERGKGSDRLL